MRFSKVLIMFSILAFSTQSYALSWSGFVESVRGAFSAMTTRATPTSGTYQQTADATIYSVTPAQRLNTYFVRDAQGRLIKEVPMSPRGYYTPNPVVIHPNFTKLPAPSTRNYQFAKRIRDNGNGMTADLYCQIYNQNGQLNGKGCMNPNVNQGRPLGDFSEDN